MTPEREHLEHLIGRRLDGAMTADQALEFDKLLLRDPQVRSDFESSRRIDVLSAALLAEVCGHGPSPQELEPRASGRRSWTRWRRAASAVAAAVVLLWGLWPTVFPVRMPNAHRGMQPLVPQSTPAAAPLLVGVPRGHTSLDYYGVLDESGEKLYLLEIRRTHQAGAGWLLAPGRTPLRQPEVGPTTRPVEPPFPGPRGQL